MEILYNLLKSFFKLIIPEKFHYKITWIVDKLIYLVRFYFYYCYFYINGELKKEKSIFLQKWLQYVKTKDSKEEIVVAMMLNAKYENTPTFVRLQRDRINAVVNLYSDGILSTRINGTNLATPYNIASLKIYEQQIVRMALGKYEKLIAMSFINEKTNVVFAQFGTAGAEVMNICRQINLPLIVHFHGIEISAKKIIEKYKEKYREMFEYASYIIAVSKYMKNTLISLGCSQEKIIYNPCVANDEYYDVQPTFSKKLFIGAGRFTAKKSPQNTILAFKKVLEKHPDAKLILAGNGELLKFCEKLIKQNHLEDSVCLPGTFNSKELKQLLSEAMAFVQHSVTAPNGDMEGTPVAVVEASLAGLPVISTFHAGIPDVIIDGKTGLLSNENDIDGMARNMIWILDNPEKAKEMGSLGKENIWKNFNVKKHIEVLDEIIYKTGVER